MIWNRSLFILIKWSILVELKLWGLVDKLDNVTINYLRLMSQCMQNIFVNIFPPLKSIRLKNVLLILVLNLKRNLVPVQRQSCTLAAQLSIIV